MDMLDVAFKQLRGEPVMAPSATQIVTGIQVDVQPKASGGFRVTGTNGLRTIEETARTAGQARRLAERMASNFDGYVVGDWR